jgi:hypothetical protein
VNFGIYKRLKLNLQEWIEEALKVLFLQRNIFMDIKNFKDIKKGCLQAKFDVSIPEWGLTIRDMTLFQKDGKKWLGMPNRQYQGKDGKPKNFEFIVFDQNTRPRFQKAVIDKIDTGQVEMADQQQNKSTDDSKKVPF